MAFGSQLRNCANCANSSETLVFIPCSFLLFPLHQASKWLLKTSGMAQIGSAEVKIRPFAHFRNRFANCNLQLCKLRKSRAISGFQSVLSSLVFIGSGVPRAARNTRDGPNWPSRSKDTPVCAICAIAICKPIAQTANCKNHVFVPANSGFHSMLLAVVPIGSALPRAAQNTRGERNPTSRSGETAVLHSFAIAMYIDVTRCNSM